MLGVGGDWGIGGMGALRGEVDGATMMPVCIAHGKGTGRRLLIAAAAEVRLLSRVPVPEWEGEIVV